MKGIIRGIERFVWWAAGTDVKILERFPSEYSKYSGIGGTILFTALMATFAGGYAFFTAFKSFELSIFFGLFWGGLIFNLDRYIVSSFGVGDGKRTISRQEFFEASPRIFMAIILGIVISTPLELKLFEKEINAEIAQTISVANKKIETDFSQNSNAIIAGYQSEIEELKTNIRNRNKDLENKRAAYYSADQAQRDEWSGKGPTGKKGKGPYWQELYDISVQLKKDYNMQISKTEKQNSVDRNRITELQKLVENAEEKRLTEIEHNKTIQAQNDGLLARLRALHTLTNENGSLMFAKWLITLLFIMIEVAPILFKMMMETGPYDQEVDQVKYNVKVKNMQKNSNLNENINFDLKIHTEKNRKRLEYELEANMKLLQKIADAQVEIAATAIEEWKKEKILEAKKDANKIIKSHVK